jgi:hypothetical protein
MADLQPVDRLGVPPDSFEAVVLPTLDRAALVRAGLDVVEETGPSLLAAGGLLLTGEVPRTTGVRAGPEA